MNINPIEALKANIRLIDHQIEKIDLEIQSRKELSAKVFSKLGKQLEIYNSAKNYPDALQDFSSGQGFLKDREHVNHLIREAKQQIQTEERSCWNDLQKLEHEKRLLEREKLQDESRIRTLHKDQN